MKINKLVKIAIKVIICKIFNKIIPVSATLSVTNNCNSNCIYCKYKSRNQQNLSLNKIKEIIDILCELGVERLGIWGGEPLLRDDIEIIVDYALNNKLYVTLDTNGYLINEKLNILKKVDHTIISLDGNRICHDANRGIETFEKVIDGIKILSNNKIKFSTITVLTKNNITKDNIDFILNLSKQYNFLTTFQILHHNSILGNNYKNILPTDREYKDILLYIYDKKKKNKLIASSNNYFKYLLNWNNLNIASSIRYTSIKCMAGKSYFNIDTDGKVYPCSFLINDIDGINCKSKSLIKDLKKIKLKANCNSCVCGCFVEYNNLFSLNISSIYQWIKNII